MKYTFKGGSHVNEHKNTCACPIQPLPAPAVVSIPMSQHIGVPAKPTVAVGDRVLLGQVIGEVGEGLGCPVHSSVSGTVKEIASKNNAFGMPIQNVVIENDGLDEPDPAIRGESLPLAECSADKIIEIIRSAGISGMGGATFPTYAKVRSAIGKVEYVIINCAECEPFITANHRLMLEQASQMIGGAEILLQALGLNEVTFAVEDNKMDAVASLRRAIDGFEKHKENFDAKVCVLKTKYPQGDERQLIFALTRREVPAGKLPSDVGCVIFNAETCVAVYHAFYEGHPLTRRVVTVDGDCVANPGNWLCPIGVAYDEIVRASGGFVKVPEKIVNGGPMMGFAQWDIHGPVTKGTSAVLFFSEEFNRPTLSHGACIHCGRCVAHCPMHLMPYALASSAIARRYDDAEKLDIMSCVECGTCSYNCPAGVEIVQQIRAAKTAIRQKQAALRARTTGGEARK